MQSLMGNPYEDEMLRRLRAPNIGIMPYQSQIKPGQAYGQFHGGNSNNGITPLPSPPRMGGPAPLPPGMQTPPGGPNTRFDPSPNPPGYITPLPSPPNAGTGGPLPPGGIINPPNQGGGYSGAQWEGLDMSGFNPTGPQTTDMSPYTINGETYYGSSSWASKLQEYLNSTGQGDAFSRPDNTSIGFQQPRQNPPITRFLPPSDGTQPPINTMPTLPVPDYGSLPPGGPRDKPDYRLARPDPGMRRPGLPDRSQIKAMPFQGQGYNRRTSSSPSLSPSFIGGAPKTKRNFGN